MTRQLLIAISILCACHLAFADQPAGDGVVEPNKVSYYKQIRPIFQAHCQGCHQPAKAGGQYVMTLFDKLAAGGESGEAAIVKGQPDTSHLIQQIMPKDGRFGSISAKQL